MKTVLTLLALLYATPALAQDFSVGWPLSCELGQDCWVAHHLDHDPVKNSYSDFACGNLTYDGHDGTDIAIRDRNQQMDVVAAADGVVLNERNDQRDHDGGMYNTEPTRLMHTECGNAVVLGHGNGWRTIYCHMKRGSVTVQKGQQVAKGDKLGEVGQSGLADFPHLHFGVMKGDTAIDPYTGDAVGEFTGACGTGAGTPLWDRDIPYDPVELYASGFSEEKPDLDAKSRDTSSPETAPATAHVLYFWFLGYGGTEGDRIRMQVTDPEGRIAGSYDTTEDKTHIRILYFAGIPNRSGTFTPGEYHGIAQLTRTLPDGQTVQRSIEHTITVQ